MLVLQDQDRRKSAARASRRGHARTVPAASEPKAVERQASDRQASERQASERQALESQALELLAEALVKRQALQPQVVDSELEALASELLVEALVERQALQPQVVDSEPASLAAEAPTVAPPHPQVEEPELHTVAAPRPRAAGRMATARQRRTGAAARFRRLAATRRGTRSALPGLPPPEVAREMAEPLRAEAFGTQALRKRLLRQGSLCRRAETPAQRFQRWRTRSWARRCTPRAR